MSADESQTHSEGGEKQATAAAAAASAERRLPRVLVVDDEPPLLKLAKTYLEEHGLTVDTAESGEAGVQKLAEDTDLVLVDLKMPGMDGIETIKAMRKKGFNRRIMVVTGYPARETIIQAGRLGVTDYITKPFVPDQLLERIEEALQVNRTIRETSASPNTRGQILEPGASVALFVPGEIEIRLAFLEEISQKAPDLLHEGGIVPAHDYFVVNDLQKVGSLAGREPTLKKNQTLDKGAVRALARICQDKYGGIVDAQGSALSAIRVQKNARLGDHLVVSEPRASEFFLGKLRPQPLCNHILESVKPQQIEPTLTALTDTWRHHEVAFLMHQLAAHENRRRLAHLVATSFLAVLNTQQILARTAAGIDADERRVLLAVMGVCGALHDWGWSQNGPEPKFGTEAYLKHWQMHAQQGFDAVRRSPLYAEAKLVIRDHHKLLIERHSRYDCYTRIVQLASDLDTMVQGDGALAAKGSPECITSPSTALEACQKMIFRARKGVYREADIDGMLSDCQFDALINYYKRLEELEKQACKSVILSPNKVHPVTALCRFGQARAKLHVHEAYCDDCSAEKTHAFRGALYNRCLQGHKAVSQLNEGIKHLGRKGKREDAPGSAAPAEGGEAAAAAAGEAPSAAADAGPPAEAGAAEGAAPTA